MGLLEGKVALVSGAARGQGRAIAVRFAEEGADVVALDMCADVPTAPYVGSRPADLARTISMVESTGQRCLAEIVDVRDTQAVRQVVDHALGQISRVDTVVANAGFVSYHAAEAMPEEAWRTMIDVNLTGTWNVVRAALPHMVSSGRGGSVIMNSSSAAHIGFQNLGHYAAAKGGIVGYMQSLAVELGPHNIRVNTLHPSTVKTAMTLNQATYDLFMPGAGLTAGSIDDETAIAEAFKQMHALPVPWVEPLDVANAALFLSSDMVRYVSGTQLRVDAGAAVR
jgi:SDR family mycofactocin-dependent oxidoreductase